MRNDHGWDDGNKDAILAMFRQVRNHGRRIKVGDIHQGASDENGSTVIGGILSTMQGPSNRNDIKSIQSFFPTLPQLGSTHVLMTLASSSLVFIIFWICSRHSLTVESTQFPGGLRWIGLELWRLDSHRQRGAGGSLLWRRLQVQKAGLLLDHWVQNAEFLVGGWLVGGWLVVGWWYLLFSSIFHIMMNGMIQ